MNPTTRSLWDVNAVKAGLAGRNNFVVENTLCKVDLTIDDKGRLASADR